MDIKEMKALVLAGMIAALSTGSALQGGQGLAEDTYYAAGCGQNGCGSKPSSPAIPEKKENGVKTGEASTSTIQIQQEVTKTASGEVAPQKQTSPSQSQQGLTQVNRYYQKTSRQVVADLGDDNSLEKDKNQPEKKDSVTDTTKLQSNYQGSNRRQVAESSPYEGKVESSNPDNTASSKEQNKELKKS